MLREATYHLAAVNVLDVTSESMAAFQVFMYGRFWVFTEDSILLAVQPEAFVLFATQRSWRFRPLRCSNDWPQLTGNFAKIFQGD